MSADTATIQKWFDAHVDDDEILAVVSVSTAEEELPDDELKERVNSLLSVPSPDRVRIAIQGIVEALDETLEGG